MNSSAGKSQLTGTVFTGYFIKKKKGRQIQECDAPQIISDEEMNFHKAGDSLYRISPYRHCFPQDNQVSTYMRSPFNFQHKRNFCDAKV